LFLYLFPRLNKAHSSCCQYYSIACACATASLQTPLIRLSTTTMHLLSLPLLLVLLPSTLAAVSTTTVTSAAPVSTSPSYENDADFQSQILAATNFYRMEQGVAAVTWNASIATYAQKWSDACVFKHSVCIFPPGFLRGFELGCCLSPIPSLALLGQSGRGYRE
jgi:hypothetical protein